MSFWIKIKKQKWIQEISTIWCSVFSLLNNNIFDFCQGSECFECTFVKKHLHEEENAKFPKWKTRRFSFSSILFELGESQEKLAPVSDTLSKAFTNNIQNFSRAVSLQWKMQDDSTKAEKVPEESLSPVSKPIFLLSYITDWNCLYCMCRKAAWPMHIILALQSLWGSELTPLDKSPAAN